MALVPFDGFLGAGYQRQQPGINSERCVNLYLEMPDKGEHGRSQGTLLSTPGLKKYWTIPGNQLVGALYTMTDFTRTPVLTVSYAIGSPDGITAHLYELPFGVGGSPVDRGALGKPGRYKITGGGLPGQYLLITNQDYANPDEGKTWVYALNSTSISVPGGGFPGLIRDTAFLDGFFFAVPINSNRIYQSAYMDATTWAALDYTIENDQTDAIVALVADHRRLWVFGQQRVEVWYSAQNPGAVGVSIIRDNSANIEVGCLGSRTPAVMNNTIIWVGRDNRGPLQAWRLNGYLAQRISTHAIEAAWQQYTVVDDAWAFAYQEEGHPFYAITFPSSYQVDTSEGVPAPGHTWVYDDSTGSWHERVHLYGVTGPVRWRANCYTYNAYLADHMIGVTHSTGHLVGDFAPTGVIFNMGRHLTSDDGQVIRRIRTCPHLYQGSTKNFYQGFALDSVNNPSNTTLSWSNNGGVSYNTALSPTVQSSSRLAWNRLGNARDRVFQVQIEDLTSKIALSGAYLDLEAGTR